VALTAAFDKAAKVRQIIERLSTDPNIRQLTVSAQLAQEAGATAERSRRFAFSQKFDRLAHVSMSRGGIQ